VTERVPTGVAWLEPLANALARESCAVLVVVAAAQGSTPRETGATMVVSERGCAGSIGGGHLEHEATRIARDALAAGVVGPVPDGGRARR
jgi:xanthine dehydrogenase accessory factor